MRWKLLVLVSFVAALVAFALWSVLTALIFGSARGSQGHDGLLIVSMLAPVALAALAGMFVYRHTARRRKTQAVLTVLLTLILTAGVYFAGSRLFPHLFGIPRLCDRPPCK
jgi:cytochrome bd-type quinol oxidase subunit 2